MIPGGVGYEVLKFDHESIREIARLPSDVRIMGALSDLAERHGTSPRDWHRGSIPLRPIFVLIAHRYCMRVSEGCPYMFTTIDEFLPRYSSLSIDEKKPLTEPTGSMPHEAWYRDGHGRVSEYVWAGKQYGWVLK